MFRFERGLRPRNRFLGQASEGAVEAPSEQTRQLGPYHRSRPPSRVPYPAGGGATTAARWMSSYLILLMSKDSRFSASFLKVWSKLGRVLRWRVRGVVRARTKFFTYG